MGLVEGFGFNCLWWKKRRRTRKNPYALDSVSEISDQYMAGDYLLVAPIFTGEKKRGVYPS